MAQHPLHHGIIWKLADLNRQGLEWCDVVANARVHGTTHRVPWEMLEEERPHLGKLPDRATLAPYLREDRKVSRDGFVSWEGSLYGVHWKWVGATVQVGERQGTVEIWAGDERIAVHPRAQQPNVPRQLYLPVGVNQFCRFTSLAWPRCWAALVR